MKTLIARSATFEMICAVEVAPVLHKQLNGIELSVDDKSKYALNGEPAEVCYSDCDNALVRYIGPRRYLRYSPETHQLEWKVCGQLWRSHKVSPYYLPDIKNLSFSGFRTSQKMLKLGWTFHPTASITEL